MIRVPKDPKLVYNAIAPQTKQGVNSLTIAEWNHIINVLKTQTNMNTKYLNDLHVFLFGPKGDGDHVFNMRSFLKELYDLLYTADGSIERAREDGDGNVITETYATRVELSNLISMLVDSTHEGGIIVQAAVRDGGGNVITETYARKDEILDLLNMNLSGLEEGHVLMYDGERWVNQPNNAVKYVSEDEDISNTPDDTLLVIY